MKKFNIFMIFLVMILAVSAVSAADIDDSSDADLLAVDAVDEVASDVDEDIQSTDEAEWLLLKMEITSHLFKI